MRITLLPLLSFLLPLCVWAAPTVEIEVRYLCDGQISRVTKMTADDHTFKVGGIAFPFETKGRCDQTIPGAGKLYWWSNVLRIFPDGDRFYARLSTTKYVTPIGGELTSSYVMGVELDPFPVVGQSATVWDEFDSAHGKVRIETQIEIKKIME